MITDAKVSGLRAQPSPDGTCSMPAELPVPLARIYWVVCMATSGLPKVAMCREWLLAEAAQDRRRLK